MINFLSIAIAHADQATDTIQLPANFNGNILTIAGDTFANFAPYITLIVGILLAVLVIGILISFLHR